MFSDSFCRTWTRYQCEVPVNLNNEVYSSFSDNKSEISLMASCSLLLELKNTS